MKYTAIEDSNGARIQEVKGCANCPHMRKDSDGPGMPEYMRCNRGPNGSQRKKKLIGHWTGAYHESCPLPSKAMPFNP